MWVYYNLRVRVMIMLIHNHAKIFCFIQVFVDIMLSRIDCNNECVFRIFKDGFS